MPATIIPFDLPLPRLLPTVNGNVDYQNFRDQLLCIDRILTTSGLENEFIAADSDRWRAAHPKASVKAQKKHQRHSRTALRCNIARTLTNESMRDFSVHLADSSLLQFFCGIGEVDRINVPSKSRLGRYGDRWKEEEVRQLIGQLLRLGVEDPIKIALSERIDFESYFTDTTCVATNIHYPVDWVLFRDATRTLMKGVMLIRKQGLKHRMPSPEEFITEMNRLCIQMTHCSTKEKKRQRKKIFRKIDRLAATVADHAQRYRDLLDGQWQRTQWTRAQAEQVLGRLDQVLQSLPQARKQARQRIISEKKVLNSDKILSFYEQDTQVIVRKKAGAEVEFGNTLFLGENVQGLILDWKLFRQSAPADVRLMEGSLERIKKIFGREPEAVGGDRGFDSESNRQALAKKKIYNGICPRDPETLNKRNGSWKFRWLQWRRSQTEARIAILKSGFLGEPMRSKGFEHRELAVAWAVLTHNLWVMTRMTPAEQALQEAA